MPFIVRQVVLSNKLLLGLVQKKRATSGFRLTFYLLFLYLIRSKEVSQLRLRGASYYTLLCQQSLYFINLG